MLHDTGTTSILTLTIQITATSVWRESCLALSLLLRYTLAQQHKQRTSAVRFIPYVKHLSVCYLLYTTFVNGFAMADPVGNYMIRETISERYD